MAGGIHGRNRLGGNSLLDCVVFGRVAGKTAAQYLFAVTKAEAERRGMVPHATAAPARQQQQQQQQAGGLPPAGAFADETVKETAKLPDSSDADYADVARGPCLLRASAFYRLTPLL